MAKVVRFPIRPSLIDRAIEQLTEDLERDRTVVQAFDAVARGDFEAQAVRDVINRKAGNLDEYVALQEQIRLVGSVQRACGYQPTPRCSCTTRCNAWPHCAGGPEGI